MESFRAAHELLKASTDDNFAQMLAQDEKNRTRLWAGMLTYADVCGRMLTYADEKNRTSCGQVY
jgi:hypothetical protein